MRKSGDWIGELIAGVIGWFLCMAILSGAFWLGLAFATWNGLANYGQSFGLLSVITLVWIYERRQSQDRWDHLNDRLNRLWEKAIGLE